MCECRLYHEYLGDKGKKTAAGEYFDPEHSKMIRLSGTDLKFRNQEIAERARQEQQDYMDMVCGTYGCPMDKDSPTHFENRLKSGKVSPFALKRIEEAKAGLASMKNQ